jgi:hypothetical protein
MTVIMKKRILITLGGVVLGLGAAGVHAQNDADVPAVLTKGCARDAEFDTIVQRIRRAVKRRDVAALMQLMVDDFSSRFPFEIGKSDFMLAWSLEEDPKHSQLWLLLPKVLRRPCFASPASRALQGRRGTYTALFEKRDGKWAWIGLSGDPDFYAKD